MTGENPLAFVLMPFDEEFEAVYERLIRSPLEEVGFVVRRADSLLNQQNILKDVVKGIADATLVVADVTGLNENVLYELGLAHGLGKRTVMVTQFLEQLPFDLRPYRANEYTTSFTAAHKIADTLKDVGLAVLDGQAEFGNPVQDFAPNALGAQPQVRAVRDRGESEKGSEGDESEDDEEEAPGFLELFELMLESTDRLTEISNEIAAETSAIGEKAESYTKKMERAQQNLGDRSVGAMLIIARDAAKDIEQYGERMRPLGQELQTALQHGSRGMDAAAAHGRIDSEEDAEQARDLIETLAEVEDSMTEAYVNVADFGQVLLTFPPMERSLSRAAKDAGSVVTDLADDIGTAQAEYARSRSLLQSRIDAYRGQED